MPSAKVQDQPDLTIPEDLPVKALVSEVKERTIEWKDKTTGEAKSAEVWDWWFKITDGDAAGGIYAGRRVKGQTDSKLTNHARNKARLWVESVTGRELPVGAGIDTDEDVVGLPCVVTVKHRRYKTSSGEDALAEEVSELFPMDGMDDVPF